MILQGIDHLMAVKQQREIAAQNAQAEQFGMKNAAKPQGAKPLPSQKRPQNDLKLRARPSYRSFRPPTPPPWCGAW